MQEATPAEEAAPAKKAAATKRATPAKKAVPAHDAVPARKVAAGKKAAPARKAPPPEAAPTEATAPTGTATPTRKTPAAKKAAKKAVAAETTTVTGTPAAVKQAGAVRKPTDAPATATPPTEPTPAAATVATPDRTPVDRPPAESDAPVRRTPERVDLVVVGRLLTDRPEQAPELLALAAVASIGPRARDWAAGIRADYPNATPDGVAALATRRFVRRAGTGAAMATAVGLLAPFAELALTSWAQAGLVLHLAAAYGQDPTHPDRAVDLLLLSGIEPDEDRARRALAEARAGGRPDVRDRPAAGPDHGGDQVPSVEKLVLAGQRLAAPLLAQGGGWMAVRLVARLLPGAGPLVAAGGGAAGAERLAARAVARYRPRGAAGRAQSQSSQERGSTE
ncbi:hypothetical protein ACFOX0_12055 [Micromonospora zhanjiangensis]|uniref:EcsC protein family protein n=1 Tax=Micromonospora zhanjiangensis TaxID=1522057 RepID=A0ABV8KKP8_9ACTN